MVPSPGEPEVASAAAFARLAEALLIPVPGVFVLSAALYFLFFRSTWRELDEEAHRHRAAILAQGKIDFRPAVALGTCALVLTLQEYYGGRVFYDDSVRRFLMALDAERGWLKLVRYDELWGYAWWAGTRVLGYVLPFAVWKIVFPKDSLLDLGLRTRGFLDHAWIYGLFCAFVIPALLLVSEKPDFGAYYPFYKTSSRSWFDFLAWEAMYFAQFFALEMFFRGFWLGALRKSFGSGAIFAMAVPYCMIHYGKPYLEAVGAIVAGVALGSLSMKTKSIYQGFLVHITIAALMDWLSLRRRHATPLYFWPQTGLRPYVIGDYGLEEQAREALARSVERTAAVVFLCVVAVVVLLVIRNRRARAFRS